jgi:hypothetical protein
MAQCIVLFVANHPSRAMNRATTPLKGIEKLLKKAASLGKTKSAALLFPADRLLCPLVDLAHQTHDLLDCKRTPNITGRLPACFVNTGANVLLDRLNERMSVSPGVQADAAHQDLDRALELRRIERGLRLIRLAMQACRNTEPAQPRRQILLLLNAITQFQALAQQANGIGKAALMIIIAP